MCSIYYEHCISYLRYGNTWGDWHGGNGGSLVGPFEMVVIGSNGIAKSGSGGYIDSIVFGEIMEQIMVLMAIGVENPGKQPSIPL